MIFCSMFFVLLLEDFVKVRGFEIEVCKGKIMARKKMKLNVVE